MIRRGGETTKRLCIIFMAAAIFCIAMFPGKGFAATANVYMGQIKGNDTREISMVYSDVSQLRVSYGTPVSMANGSQITYTARYYNASNLMATITGSVKSDASGVFTYDLNKTHTFSSPVNLTRVVITTTGTDNISYVAGLYTTVTYPDPPPTPPAAPTGLVVVPGNEKLTLTWDANRESDLAGYNVYLNGTKVAGPVTTRQYVFSGLKGGTSYTVSVSAVNKSSIESSKTSVSGTPTTSPPPPDTSPPTVPVLQGKPGKAQAVLDWTKSPESDLAGYYLYQDGSKVGTYTTNTATVSGLKNGTTYKFQVTSFDIAGNESVKSNQVSVTPVEKFDVNLIPNGDSIIVQIGGGTGPYVINWGAAQKTVDQSQYVIPNLQFATEYTVTITDANGLTYTSKVNTGTDKAYTPPTFPNPQQLFQRMLDVFGTAGTIAMAIIGGAIALGILCVLAMWAWRLLRNWLARAK